jgi:hypothetical protein
MGYNMHSRNSPVVPPRELPDGYLLAHAAFSNCDSWRTDYLGEICLGLVDAVECIWSDELLDFSADLPGLFHFYDKIGNRFAVGYQCLMRRA